MAQAAVQQDNDKQNDIPDDIDLSFNEEGLSSAEIQEREKRGETNDYEARVGRSYWQIVRDNLLNLFNIVLGTMLVIVIVMGDYATAFFAGFSVVTNSFMGMIQEINAKRKLDNLATLSEQQVTVWRDGAKQNVSMRRVVKDEVITIEPGDKLVVDGVVMKSDSLEIDESLLTGESDAVYKEPGNEVYSGSYCVAGSGVMRATRVGEQSNINQLSKIAKEYQNVKTPTQKRIDIIVELTVIIMFAFVPMLFISDLLVTQPPTSFLNAVRNAVVFVTSLVPQGLVLVAILSLTIGAIKISRHETLVQKVNAVESLANATTLCFDKTGTLTRNELAVTDIIQLNDKSEDEIIQKIANYLDNLAHLNRTASAVQEYTNERTSPADERKQREIPFTSGRKWGAVVFESETLIMGAPERVLKETDAAESTIKRADDLSKEGMRVLAFARMTQAPENDQIGAADPIALIVMSDQIREDIEETLQSFRDEHISLKVISGDNLETVRAIASQSGMDVTGAYKGDDLEAMSDEELAGVVNRANVFARVEPGTKRRIISALQRNKEYVAMVGDGVNDVPALKQADLAIVMNDGTQISKDVADIVLLNNAMSTLPRAFVEGTGITQTIFGSMKLFLVRNVYNILLFIFVMFMSLPFPITPVQISWATFGTINIPATFLAAGWFRPEKMVDFRDDVLDYVITGGIIGTVLLTILYVVVYFGTGRDVTSVRSAVTIFTALYNAYIVMTVKGVNFYQPKTFITYWKTVLMMTVLTVLTIWAMYILPDLFEFASFDLYGSDWWIMPFIALLYMASIVLLPHGMKYRYLLRRMWALFEKDEKKVAKIVGDK